MKMFRNKKNSVNDLQSVLKQTNKAAEQGYKDANNYMKGIRRAVDSVAKIIGSCKRELEKYNVNDASLVKSVQDQLVKVQNQFASECDETERNLHEKKRQTAKFNITLFGRTMAGKSTLMEILTHGKGDSMGHGGQRTTRETRTYEWNGMTVTDVPGIDAYDGKDDEVIAEAAATYADLILFLITAGQPEGTEADWLVKLKKKDKPLICICNYKKAIDDEHKMRRFLANEDVLEKKMNVTELLAQFDQFIHTQLPNEKVKYFVTHLLAKFYSQQPQYKDKSVQLAKFSRFNAVEQAIIDEVVRNGAFYRKKCFLSIVDVPLYEQSVALFNFSSDSYRQSQVVYDKIKDLNRWQKDFNYTNFQSMHDDIDDIFLLLESKIDGFAEDHADDSDAGTAWKRVVERFDINTRINKCLKNIYSKNEIAINNIFNDLQQEMKFSYNFNSNFGGDFSFTNWKKVNGWIAGIAGVGAGIAFLVSNPIGWVLTGIGLIFGFFSWLSGSRQRKLDENRRKISRELYKQVGKMKKDAHNAASNWYHKNINEGIQSIAYNRLQMISRSLLALTNSERELALGYTRNHVDISTKLVANILDEFNTPEYVKNSIVKVARIPSKKLVVVTNGQILPQYIKDKITNKIGNNESVVNYILDNRLSTEQQVRKLFAFFQINTWTTVRNIDGQTVVYVDNKNYTQEERDNMILIQQILLTHIIQKNYEE